MEAWAGGVESPCAHLPHAIGQFLKGYVGLPDILARVSENPTFPFLGVLVHKYKSQPFS